MPTEVLTAGDGDVRIRPVAVGDVDLYLALRGDAATMRDLGGPLPAGRIRAGHAREVAETAAGRAWVVVAEVATAAGWVPAGNVSLVGHDPAGAEIGWVVHPDHRGRGVARTAVRLLLGLPGAAQRWGTVTALPSVGNAASNRLCASLGFADRGEVDVEFAGRPFRCRRWELDLRGQVPQNVTNGPSGPGAA
ncbi:GNAT family N-acetyltransferase [Geodermatophilus sp. SYSU D01036]